MVVSAEHKTLPEMARSPVFRGDGLERGWAGLGTPGESEGRWAG